MNSWSSVAVLVLCATLMLLNACSKAPPPTPVKDTVFAPTVNQLNKARDTQQVLDTANQHTDAALKQAE